jgi:hypothetical protein
MIHPFFFLAEVKNLGGAGLGHTTGVIFNPWLCLCYLPRGIECP